MSRTVYVIPHCHWDREWYQPHELFRWRLVQMIDELLDHMEQHPEYSAFTLDGQTIVVRDYLELRPENESRLRAMIESGRIVIGPWWVQPDEFLPSGESHIRSFQRGIRAAEALGGCMSVGHCADQFGHIAQMPQIMRQLGLTSACLWRGVPEAVPGWTFSWEAPDGTRIPVIYLRNSYSSGWRLPRDTDDLLDRVRRQERDLRDGEPALLMNGTDHSRMQKDVPEILAAAAGRGYDFRLATLAEFAHERMRGGIDEYVHPGELRSPDRSNVLSGVLSARHEIKRRDFEVSSALERFAEPLELLCHLHSGPDGLPALKHAWGLLLENSPHDSICGCSVDQTHREMFPRYDRAEQLAGQVARESMAHVLGKLDVPVPGALALFRPVPHAAATFECAVPADWSAEAVRFPSGATAAVAVGPTLEGAVLMNEEVSPRGALRHLDFIREGRYDAQYVESMTWQLDGRHLLVETRVGSSAINAVDDETVRAEVREAVMNGLVDTARVIVRESSTRLLRGVAPASQAIGIELLTPAPATVEPDDLAVDEGRIANSYYDIRFKDGRLRIRDWAHGLTLKNACAFVDEGDRGDEYNADILTGAVTTPVSARLIETVRDSVSATLRYKLILRVPERLGRARRRRSKTVIDLPVRVAVTLWRGLPRVDFDVTVDNTARDHRLRVLFPLPFETATAITENQFHVAERALEAPPWNGASLELPPTTFPQKTFAAFEGDGAGIAVFNRGLQEGEVVRSPEGRQAYALTLLRCVGWLSRPDLVSRRGSAGPTIATEDSQSPGLHRFRFALTSYRGGWREAAVQAMAHAFAHPPLVFATNGHDGPLDGTAPLVAVTPLSVIPSALHRSDAGGAPIMRFYNSSNARTTAHISAPRAGLEAERTDLMERAVGEAVRLGDGWTVTMKPWEIASLRLR